MVLERICQACRLRRVPAAAPHGVLDLAMDANRSREGTSSLEHQILVRLLTNISLWAKAPPDFQFGLVTSVLGMVRDAPERFRQTLPLETVLASIRICCPDEVSEASQAPEDAGVGTSRASIYADSEREETTSSAERDWTSMSWRERLHLRDFLWRVVRLLLEKEVGPQDGVTLIRFMASCDDARLVSTWCTSSCRQNVMLCGNMDGEIPVLTDALLLNTGASLYLCEIPRAGMRTSADTKLANAPVCTSCWFVSGAGERIACPRRRLVWAPRWKKRFCSGITSSRLSSCLNTRNAIRTVIQQRRCRIKLRSAIVDVDIFD